MEALSIDLKLQEIKQIDSTKPDFDSRFESVRYLALIDIVKIEESYHSVVEQRLRMTAMDLDEDNFKRLVIININSLKRLCNVHPDRDLQPQSVILADSQLSEHRIVQEEIGKLVES